MIYAKKPTKVSIYVANCKKTIDEVKAITGADEIINGGLFDTKPRCWLKVSGTLLASDQYSYWGYGWNDDGKLVMDSTINIGRYQNFIACVALARNGKPEPPIYGKELGGKRGRTAIGLLADGRVLTFCTKDGTAETYTPETLQAELLSRGCVSALMLDGGASSQGIFPNGRVSANRKVHNFICIWYGEVTDAPTTDCPYPAPTHNVGRWCFFYSKDDARWVQWQLNRHGYGLEVDGVVGKITDGAIRSFQRSHLLKEDGICGKLTREALLK